MKRPLPAILAAFGVAGLAAAAIAQTVGLSGLVGQSPNQTIAAYIFSANTDSAGFNDTAMTPAAVAPATATTQALAQPILTRTTVITTCSVTTGFVLPSVQRYVGIVVLNRSGGSCLIWPTVGATVETALGTNGAVNAPFTMLTNTDVIFRPILTGTTVNWLQ